MVNRRSVTYSIVSSIFAVFSLTVQSSWSANPIPRLTPKYHVHRFVSIRLGVWIGNRIYSTLTARKYN
jgi:uncharacterized membrane protein